MKNILRWRSYSVTFAVLSICFFYILHAYSIPQSELLKLPEGQLSLESKTGMKYLQESINNDYQVITPYFETQSHVTYCGVATSVAVINALTGKKVISQETYFIPEVKSSLFVKLSGMSLNQLNTHFLIHGMKTTIFNGNKISLKKFRQLAINNVKNPNNFFVINYFRKTLHQVGGGHISPVVAYHQQSDSMLVLDTASYKYPPTWIKTESLWKAVATTGSDGDFRGIVEVSN